MLSALCNFDQESLNLIESRMKDMMAVLVQ